MNQTFVNSVAGRINREISRVLVGKEQIIDYVLAAFLAGGHVLLEDMPGTGKTTLARLLAAAVSGSYKRIQFTPDLLPGDVTGIKYYDQKQGEFVFREGSVFANIVLADEINRAAPRTQSALLESMEEAQVTADGESRALPAPFFVIATQNPIETVGTFPLPEAQLDRFMMKLKVGYPDYEQELDMIERHLCGTMPHNAQGQAARADNARGQGVQPVCGLEELQKLREEVKKVYVHSDVRAYLLRIVRATREDVKLACGVSPRGTLAFVRAAQALAAIRGRDYVTPQEVKELAPYVLGHRLSGSGFETESGQNYILALVNRIEVPVEKL